MRTVPLPFIGGFYADETRPWSEQDVCNWLPCVAEQKGTKTPTIDKTPPGLKPFVRMPGVTGAVRGTYNCEGRFFAVIGNRLYQVTNKKLIVPIGTIAGSGRVSFAHNQIEGGNELLVVNGSSGYIYNTATSVFTRITDEGYPGAIVADFADGYLIQIEPGRRFAFHSELADGLSYNTLDRFTSETSPDLLVTLAVSNNQVILFSETTLEVFENRGSAQQPYRTTRIVQDKGAAGRFSVAKCDNTVYFMGSDGMFYRMQGYNPVRISTRPIEQAVRGLNWSQVFAFVWEDSGHSVVYWTFPDGRTWGYDIAQQQWHRRASYSLDRWRVNSMTNWKGKWYAGDFQDGRIWELDWEYMLEGDQRFISELTTPTFSDNQNRLIMERLEIILATGQEPTKPIAFPAQPESPQITGDAPDSVKGSPYVYTYTVTGGTGTVTGSIVSGALPEGLSFNPTTFTISGIPSEAGSFVFTVRVTDENQLWNEKVESVNVSSSMLALATFSYLYVGNYNNLQIGATVNNSGTARSLSVSPSSLYMAFGAAGSIRILKKIADGLSYSVMPNPDDAPASVARSTAFHPGGEYLATIYGTTLNIYRVNEDKFVSAFKITDIPVSEGIAWSQDGSKLAVSMQLGSPYYGMAVYDFNEATAELSNLATPQSLEFAQPPVGFDFSSDSKYLALKHNNGLFIFNVGSVLTKASSAVVNSGIGAYFSADDNYIYAVASGESNPVRAYGFDQGAITAPVSPGIQPDVSSDCSISSDRKALAFGLNTGPYVMLIDGINLTPAENQPEWNAGSVQALAWTPRGLDG